MPPAPRIDELKKRYEENPRRFFAPLANEYRKAGDLEAAIDLCKMHLEEQPGHLSGHIVYGQALYESSRPADARAIFEAALQLDPENLIALRHLGDIAKSDGDAPTAKHWYQRVLDADPRNEEVTALIESLGQAPPPPTVIVAEPKAPPPPPNYADENKATVLEASAPTPVIPIEAVAPPEPPTIPTPIAPRASIGLMDLDLNLADSTAPTVDLLGVAPSAVPEPPTVAEAPPTMAEEPAPVIEEVPLAFEDMASSAAPGIETFGDVSLDAGTPHEPALEALDTSFGVEPVDESPTFASAAESPSFGDSLDVTAGEGLELGATDRLSLLDGIPAVDDVGTVAIGESITEPKPVSAHAAEVAETLAAAGETIAPLAAEPIMEIVAEAAPPSAEPAPATPGDFDALFGNAPIADVTIGGDASQVTDAAGFIADSFVGREASDQMLDQAPDITAPPSPFVTETMAELYLQQGFREEALNVYRQLLAQNPEDTGLAERVKHLEHGTRSSLAIDSESAKIEEEVRASGSIAVVAAAAAAPETAAEPPVASSAAEPFAIEHERQPIELEPVAPLAEAVPAFLVEAPTPAVPAPTAPAPAAPAPSGPSAREIFARIAARRAMTGGDVAHAALAEPTVDASTPSAGAAAAPAALTVAPGGPIDQLFGMSGVTALDEGAAVAMATAFGGQASAAPIMGEPTRQGTDELSLSSVFKSEAPRSSSGVERQSRTLRFDQFFAGTDGAAAPEAPPPGAQPGADDAQFSDWLKGLKGS